MSSTHSEDAAVLRDRHPPFLKILFLSETAGNFSHYGMRNLLILYMIKGLFFPDQRAYEIYASFVAVLYITPFLGGILADRFVGLKTLLIMGTSLVMIGTFFLALIHQAFFYLGMSLVALGYGLYRPSVLRLLSRLYEADDPRRESGFTIFFTASNLGPLFASVICGWVAVTYGWHWGFFIASSSMAVSIFILLRNLRTIHAYDPPKEAMSSKIRQRWIHILMVFSGLSVAVFAAYILYNARLFNGVMVGVLCLVLAYLGYGVINTERESRLRILVIIILLIYHMLFFVFFEQLSTSVTLFIDRVVMRDVYGFTLPTVWFQSLNPLFIVFLGPVASSFWMFLHRKKRDFTVSFKFIAAFLFICLGFYVLAYGASHASCEGYVSMLWLVLGVFLHSVGEILIAPIGLSAITQLSPLNLHGFFIGLFYFSVSLGNYWAGYIAQWTAIKHEPGASIKAIECVTIYEQVFYKIGFYAVVIMLSILIFYPFINNRLVRTKES